MSKAINEETKQRLRSLCLNAIATKIIYTNRLNNLRKFLKITDIIILSLPVIIFSLFSLPRYLNMTDDTLFFIILNIFALIISVGSAIFGIYRMSLQTDKKIESYSQGLTDNINLYHETKFVINEAKDDVAQWYLKMSSQLEKTDTSTLADITIDEKRNAYRGALKEFDEGSCPYCGCDPNKFLLSDNPCDRCGNTKKKGFNL